MDGLGTAPQGRGNAVVLANPRHLSKLWSTNPHTYLLASGEAVGLPRDTKGNSEVGHINMGAGRVVNQTLKRINYSINNKNYFSNNVLNEALNHALRHNSNIHILSLVGEGGVHAHTNHLLATLDFLSVKNFNNKVFIHAFTDGRDSKIFESNKSLDKIQAHINKISLGQIATLCGRAWAMDRNQNWDRIKKAYDLLTKNTGQYCSTYQNCLNEAHRRNISDEYIEPTVLIKNSNIQRNDVVLFLNFRPDRALQLTQSFVDKDFKHFQQENIQPIFFASMIEYRKKYPSKVLFPKQYINFPVGNVIASYNLRQLRIAESEKFPHVTYFFNGGTAIKYLGEDRIEVPSPSVPTYDLAPEMSALKVTEVLLSRINQNIYDFIVVNFANADMVGHTGNIPATIKAVSTVDYCVNKLVEEFTRSGGVVLITADHGNAEELVDIDSGKVNTEHSYNPVPFIIVGLKNRSTRLKYGALKDIAPTILDLMDLTIPSEMSGISLLPSL